MTIRQYNVEAKMDPYRDGRNIKNHKTNIDMYQ